MTVAGGGRGEALSTRGSKGAREGGAGSACAAQKGEGWWKKAGAAAAGDRRPGARDLQDPMI